MKLHIPPEAGDLKHLLFQSATSVGPGGMDRRAENTVPASRRGIASGVSTTLVNAGQAFSVGPAFPNMTDHPIESTPDHVFSGSSPSVKFSFNCSITSNTLHLLLLHCLPLIACHRSQGAETGYIAHRCGSSKWISQTQPPQSNCMPEPFRSAALLVCPENHSSVYSIPSNSFDIRLAAKVAASTAFIIAVLTEPFSSS